MKTCVEAYRELKENRKENIEKYKTSVKKVSKGWKENKGNPNPPEGNLFLLWGVFGVGQDKLVELFTVAYDERMEALRLGIVKELEELKEKLEEAEELL